MVPLEANRPTYHALPIQFHGSLSSRYSASLIFPVSWWPIWRKRNRPSSSKASRAVMPFEVLVFVPAGTRALKIQRRLIH